MSKTAHPLILIVLDGFGHRDEVEANAIAAAHKPFWENICKKYPYTLISGSGTCVGLPPGQMGNSEVGHMNIGAGRIIQQDLTRIDYAIETGDFFYNSTLLSIFQKAKQSHQAIHVMGLLSPGGVHSHEKHIHALLKMAAQQGVKYLYIHAFLDGRDTPPKSAATSIIDLEKQIEKYGCGKIISLIGRYYAMDRDQRWERIERAYHLITQGIANNISETALEGLSLAYQEGESDEFIQPISIRKKLDPAICLNDNDIVIFMNFRADRARELTQALFDPQFNHFSRQNWPKLDQLVSLTEYDENFDLPIVFPPQSFQHIFAQCISQQHFRQLRIAETEKYAHVTFFFNCGVEKPYPLEDRLLIPSPRVATYDLCPQMSALEITKQLMQIIPQQQYDVIICNFANADMVGHTGDLLATIQAIEIIDKCLSDIVSVALHHQSEVIITADHGNAEKMFDSYTQQIHTAHTNALVPFLYIGRNALITKENGKLSDIAPTMLYLLDLPIPIEMTGSPLVKLV